MVSIGTYNALLAMKPEHRDISILYYEAVNEEINYTGVINIQLKKNNIFIKGTLMV